MKDDEVFFTESEMKHLYETIDMLYRKRDDLINSGLGTDLEKLFSGVSNIMVAEEALLEERNNGENIFKEVH